MRADETTPTVTDTDGVHRPNLLKGGALLAGGGWVAPLVVDSVSNPAGAAGCGSSDLPQTFTTPGNHTVYIAAGTTVAYDVRGAGGGSGGAGGTGGSTNGSPGSISGGAGATPSGKVEGAGGVPADLPNVATGSGGGGGYWGGGYWGGGGGGGSTSQSTSKGASGGGGGSGSAYANNAGTATAAAGPAGGAGVNNTGACGAGGGNGWWGGHGKVSLGCDSLPQSYPSSLSNLDTPEFTDSQTQDVVLTGRVQPAASGRPVSLYREDSGGAMTLIGGANTDSNGDFSIKANVMEVSDYHFYSAAQPAGQDTYQQATSTSFEVKSLRLHDGFDYVNTAVLQAATQNGQPKWFLRAGTTDYATDPGANRRYTKASFEAISFEVDPDYPANGKVMVFSYVPDGNHPGDPNPRYKIPMITCGTLGLKWGSPVGSVGQVRPGRGGQWHPRSSSSSSSSSSSREAVAGRPCRALPPGLRLPPRTA